MANHRKTDNKHKGKPDNAGARVWIRRIAGTAIGTVVGGFIGYFWCGISGSCPITSSPAVAAVAGGIFGLLWTLER